MAFHPYPQLIRAVFNPQRFGPPRSVTRASTWPWIDRLGFGSSPTDVRPFQTRFRYGSGPEDLNLPVRTNSPDHNAKGTRSERRRPKPPSLLPPLVGTRFQGLFHSPPGVLFTFPSRYWFTIGHEGVFSLGGWSPRIRAGFHVSRATRDTARGLWSSRTGLSPSMAGLSMPLRLDLGLPRRGPTTPIRQAGSVWAVPRSLAATRGIAVAFSSWGY